MEIQNLIVSPNETRIWTLFLIIELNFIDLNTRSNNDVVPRVTGQ